MSGSIDGLSQTVEVTVPFPASGTAGFHCKFHPSMTGTLRVA